jgi:hypothetical protein
VRPQFGQLHTRARASEDWLVTLQCGHGTSTVSAIVEGNIVRVPIAEREQRTVARLEQRDEHNPCGLVADCACVPHVLYSREF